MFHMGTKSRKISIESEALAKAIKRAMVTRGMSTPALAKSSGVPYATLRKILELNSVADYEQIRKIADALMMSAWRIVEDAETLIENGDLAVNLDAISDDERTRMAVAHYQSSYGAVANEDENKDAESEYSADDGA